MPWFNSGHDHLWGGLTTRMVKANFVFWVFFFSSSSGRTFEISEVAKFLHDELHQNNFHCVLCMCQISGNSELLWVFFLLLFVVFGRKFLLKKQNLFSMCTLHSVMSASFKFLSEVVYSATSRHILWNIDVLEVCNICLKYFLQYTFNKIWG
jgi:hypothetical protein